MAEDENESAQEPSRSEVGEYVHDLAAQLATLARDVGLERTAEALTRVCSVVEAEF